VAAEVINQETFIVLVNDGMLAGNLRVGEVEIGIRLTANRKGQEVYGYGSRLVCLTNYQAGCIFCGLHN
jgi:hypothetical protein